ncbi:hypothetical protein [Mucilaginibacter flavidus]|uniref:hypothetical protein n=1 Tax=Mucilaginibacter flavidus TaxID=2949309 RepID=UPI002092C153|nr:hypothetical protein [Mucilaginibacter flavidus]MCO5950878.1 hypothetical protein [Mucilaginibacter flavidus]
MKTVEVKTTAINNNRANITGHNNVTAKASNLPVSIALNGEAKKDEPKRAETPAPVQATEQPKEIVQAENSPKIVAEQPKAEEPKKVAEEVKPAKPVLNLESTLKLVEELHRRKVQRDKLMDTIQSLEAFEVNQKDEAEESGITNYSRCELTIADDKGKSFTTKNPVIIFHVTQYVNALCIDKLAQIEAGIIIPA